MFARTVAKTNTKGSVSSNHASILLHSTPVDHRHEHDVSERAQVIQSATDTWAKPRLPVRPGSPAPGEPPDRLEQASDGSTREKAAASRNFSKTRIFPRGGPEGRQSAFSFEAQRQHAAEVAHSPGSPLPVEVQRDAALRFGHSFSHVRIHTDDRATGAAASLDAAAFTLGSDIVFGARRYAPNSLPGKLLLHHELRHVAQQRFARRVETPELDSPQSSHELQARQILNPRADSLPVQRIQCAPEDGQYSLGGGIVDTVGKSAFGDTTWPFIKAVFEGFVGGLQADVKSGRADEAKGRLSKLLVPWNAATFYGGYLVGFVIGLVSPITDLVKGIIGAVKLAVSALDWLAKWSPVGVAVSPERQQKISMLMGKFSDLAVQFGQSLSDFAADPKGTIKKFSGFLDDLMQLALGKARELGAKAAHSIFDFLEKDFFDMGKGIGEVIGALIAQVLLVVFSDAIGNLISKGASFLGKAAEFLAGKAVEIFEWVKGFGSQVASLLRNAVKGALKLFEGLANKAIEAFDALVALFTESQALDAGGEKVAAGVGRGVAGSAPNVMESRMVSSTRTSRATVSDLKPAKIHPSNIGKEVPPPPETGKAPFDEPLTESEKGLTRDELRRKHILEEQGELQQAARGATKEEAATGHGRREVRTPGKSIPLRFERGQFAHDYAELLISESELPSGLTAELTVDLPGGRVRLDRVDFERGVYYEIKPNTVESVEEGTAQIRKYAEYMNRNYPLKDGRQWAGRVVTYQRTDAIALFGL